jgi:hypothetical protein
MEDSSSDFNDVEDHKKAPSKILNSQTFRKKKLPPNMNADKG